MFNEKFTSRFPTADERKTAKATWTKTLNDVSDDEIAEGLQACKSWENKFAPTLIEFRKLCIANRKPVQAPQTEYIGDPGSYLRRLMAERSEIAKIIKDLMFHMEPWPKVSKPIATEMNKQLAIVRNLHPGMNDLDVLSKAKQMLNEELEYALLKRKQA